MHTLVNSYGVCVWWVGVLRGRIDVANSANGVCPGAPSTVQRTSPLESEKGPTLKDQDLWYAFDSIELSTKSVYKLRPNVSKILCKGTMLSPQRLANTTLTKLTRVESC